MLRLHCHYPNPVVFYALKSSPRHSSSLSLSGGGQNLSERYKRLEKSIREKHALSHRIADLSPPQPLPTSDPRIPFLKDNLHTFRGFVIPKEPKPPESDECCMSGCAICVYDLYEESLDTYNEAVVSLRKSLVALGIPEPEWPPSLQPSSAQQKTNQTINAKKASMDAFEAMEQALKVNRDADRSKDDRRTIPVLSDVKSLYEGLRWVVFSNR